MLKQAGLDPDKDVTIMPVGDPGTMLASLKNKVIDAAMAVEPTQTAAVQSLKFAKTMVDIEGGGGPSVFHPYAYNGVFVHSAFLKDHPDTARAIVAAIVEACAVVNDPARMSDLMDVAANYMKGSDPEVVKAYLDEVSVELRRRSRLARVSTTSAPCWSPPRSSRKRCPTNSLSPPISCQTL